MYFILVQMLKKNYCDCSELDSKAGEDKYITFNGRIVSKNLVGNLFIVSYNTFNGGDKRPSDVSVQKCDMTL